VWGSYGVAVLVLGIELFGLRRRGAAAFARARARHQRTRSAS
jgi:heme exporter protein CcmD